jgi:hypothetical protein
VKKKSKIGYINTHVVEPKGSNFYSPGKKEGYRYVNKFVHGVNVPDLAELIGPEATAKLIKYYGGHYMYIPKIKTIQRQLLDAMIREKYNFMVKKGASKASVERHLSKEFDIPLSTIVHKLGKWFYNPKKSKQVKQGKLIKHEIDKKLIEIVSVYKEIFKKFGII